MQEQSLPCVAEPSSLRLRVFMHQPKISSRETILDQPYQALFTGNLFLTQAKPVAGHLNIRSIGTHAKSKSCTCWTLDMLERSLQGGLTKSVSFGSPALQKPALLPPPSSHDPALDCCSMSTFQQILDVLLTQRAMESLQVRILIFSWGLRVDAIGNLPISSFQISCASHIPHMLQTRRFSEHAYFDNNASLIV